MSSLVRLGRNSIIYGVGQVVTRALSVLFMPLFTRYMTPQDYGAVGLLTLVTSLLQPVFSCGTSIALGPVYFKSEDPAHRRGALFTAFVFNGGMGLALWFVGSSGLGRHGVALGRSELEPLVPYALATAAFGLPLTVAQLYCQFEELSAKSVLFTLNQTVITVSAASMFVVHWHMAAKGMLLASAVGTGTTALFGALVLLKARRASFSRALLAALLRGGVPLLGGVGAYFLINNGPRIVLERTAGLTNLGYFTLGVQLAIPMDVAVGAFTTAWYPFFMSFMTRTNDAPPVFGRILRLFVWGFGAVTLMMFVFSRAAVRILAAPSFEPAYVVVGLVAASRLCWGVYNIYVPGVYFAGKLGSVSTIQGIAALGALAFAWALVPFSPLLGGAAALVLGHLLLVLLQMIWNRRYRQNVVAVGELRLPRLFAIYVVTTALSLMPRHWPLRTELVASVLLASCAMVSIALLAPKEERKDVWRLVRTRFGYS